VALSPGGDIRLAGDRDDAAAAAAPGASDADAVVGGGGQENDEGDDADEREGARVAGEEDEAGMDVDAAAAAAEFADDDAGAADGAADAAVGSDDEGARSEDGDDDAAGRTPSADSAAAADDAFAPGAPMTAAQLESLPAAAAARLYWAHLRRAAQRTFWAALADQRLARAPVAGLLSPAFALRAARPLRVPIDDVQLVTDPAQLVLPATAAAAVSAANGEQAALVADALVGQLVGLCCAAGAASPPGHGVTYSGWAQQAPLPTRASSLPCAGLGYVIRYDRASRCLHLVTPVPLAALASPAAPVDVLVAWVGASDVPAQLLYRDDPVGDAFAFPAATAPASRVAAAKSGFARKNLKRRRLGK
jgi:hypothetical protein